MRSRVFAAIIAASSIGAFGLGTAGSAHANPVASQRIEGAVGSSLTHLRALATHASVASALQAGSPVPAMTVHDPSGDAKFPQGDLTGSGVLQNAHGTAFGATVKSPHNPATDTIWREGNAIIIWFLDRNGDGSYDNQIILGDNTSHVMIAVVTDRSGNNLVCNATPTFLPSVGYRVTAGPGCLPHLDSVRFGTAMVYDTVIDNNTPADLAPDAALSPSTAVQQGHGYWMLGADGHVYAFGQAQGFAGRVPGAEAMAPRKDGTGYWVVDFSGKVTGFGSARTLSAPPSLGAGEIVTAISTTVDDKGYWLFTNRGRAIPAGNAASFGDMSGKALNGPIVASVATATGRGYYMVGSDGGIFTFGDARFHGSTGSLRLNKPIVGISPTPKGDGYWLVGSDGGVFAFDAPFRGSMGGKTLSRPIDGLVAFGNGYLMAASDGGVFDFSNKAFDGSLAGQAISAPIVGLAAFSV
jgi:hypothetical protein